MGLITKPMRLDPLFWEIFGLSENQKLPLSFRANGSFVLRPPAIQHCIASDLTDVEDIADAVLKWANQKSNELLETISVGQMLVDLTEQNLQRGESITLQICLQILAGDKGAALQTCINARAKQKIHHATEAYVTYSNLGKRIGFCELAQDWLQQRSGTIQPAR